MKKTLSIIASAACMFTMASAAQAASSVTGLFNAAPTATLLSDNTADFVINGVGNDPTKVDVGDVLVTIVGINTIGPTTIGSGTGFNEVTAISAVKIATAGDIDLGPPGADDSFGAQSIDLWQFTATPLTAADAALFDWTAHGRTNDGTLIGLVYEDAAQDYTRDSTVAIGLASATNTHLAGAVLDIGLVVANGDFLSVIAPRTIADFGTIPAATAVDNTNIALDGTIVAQAWSPLIFNANITGGNGGFSSPSVTSGFPIFDNLDYTVTANIIPEPSTFILLGSGLLGAGLYGRRRFRK